MKTQNNPNQFITDLNNVIDEFYKTRLKQDCKEICSLLSEMRTIIVLIQNRAEIHKDKTLDSLISDLYIRYKVIRDKLS